MKDILQCAILFLVSLLPTVCGAQTERRYYNDTDGVIADRAGAETYVIFEKQVSGYSAKQYNIKGRNVVMEGGYRSIPTTLDKEREGMFTYYRTGGRKSSEGAYKDNLRTGKWETYAYVNGNIKNEANYLLDSLDGIYTSYDIMTGEKRGEGVYKNGELIGTWKSYVNGKLASEDEYMDDKLVLKKIYYANGTLRRKIVFGEHEKVVSGQAFDSSGKEIVYQIEATDTTSFSYVEKMPQTPYNINQYLAGNITYPKKAIKENIEGRVLIRFIVDEEGNVVNPKVMKGVSPEIDMEALRVVAKMPKWIPGMQNGDPVKVYYNLPIAFTLQ